MARMKISFISWALNREVDITVILPSISCPEAMQNTHHEADPEYPVLYLLHGYANNHNTWSAYTNVEYFAEEHNICVVMMSGENKSYFNHEGEDERYFDFVSQELPEYIESILPVSKKAENRYICGLSMGGYGALLHGLTNSQRYAAIGGLSAATTIPFGKGDEGEAMDLFKLADKCAEEDRRIPVYMAIGDKDFLLEADTEFKDHLEKLGFKVDWHVTPGYGHEWRFWNIEIEKFMDWIPRTDRYFEKYGPKRGI